jgi:hypothetical protein
MLLAGVVTSPATAASHQGRIQIKGVGSYYSGPNAVVSEVVARGTTDQFEVQVVNTGSTLAQYNIRVQTSGMSVTTGLYAGPLSLTPLAAGPDGYYTAPIAPGKTQSFILKAAVPKAAQRWTEAVNTLSLTATDGTLLDSSEARTDAAAPTYGTSPWDLYGKQGAQQWVGATVSPQSTMSAPAIKVGGSAVFSVKLQNDSNSPSVIDVSMYPGAPSSCSSVTVLDGKVDVTETIGRDVYLTPVLAPHASKTLTVTFKRTVGAGCTQSYDSEYFNVGFGQLLQVVVPYPAV